MITEDYVSFETAKLLKEKGFNGDIASCYILEDSTHHIMSDKVVQSEYYESQDSNEHGHLIQAPTLQMARKWLREIHDIDIMIWVENYNGIKQYISDCWKNVTQINSNFHRCGRFSSYNEACEVAIKYCLENLI